VHPFRAAIGLRQDVSNASCKFLRAFLAGEFKSAFARASFTRKLDIVGSILPVCVAGRVALSEFSGSEVRLDA
jgi:hypothetical protein